MYTKSYPGTTGRRNQKEKTSERWENELKTDDILEANLEDIMEWVLMLPILITGKESSKTQA